MISLILISGFLVVAVFLRIIIQYQRTGDHGVRAASKKAPLMEILPGTVFILTFCFALALIVLGYLGSIKLSRNLGSGLAFCLPTQMPVSSIYYSVNQVKLDACIGLNFAHSKA